MILMTERFLRKNLLCLASVGHLMYKNSHSNKLVLNLKKLQLIHFNLRFTMFLINTFIFTSILSLMKKIPVCINFHRYSKKN